MIHLRKYKKSDIQKIDHSQTFEKWQDKQHNALYCVLLFNLLLQFRFHWSQFILCTIIFFLQISACLFGVEGYYHIDWLPASRPKGTWAAYLHLEINRMEFLTHYSNHIKKNLSSAFLVEYPPVSNFV